MRTFSKQSLERHKGQNQAGDNPLPEIGQVAVHKLISPEPVSKMKSNNTAKLKNNQQTTTAH
jgi:homoaconitase/3-isopropylmalate dehydratase large subunit